MKAEGGTLNLGGAPRRLLKMTVSSVGPKSAGRSLRSAFVRASAFSVSPSLQSSMRHKGLLFNIINYSV